MPPDKPSLEFTTSPQGPGWREALAMAGLGSWHWNSLDDQVTFAAPPDLLRDFPSPPDGRLADFVGAVHPDDRAGLEAALRQAGVAGGAWNVTFRLGNGDRQFRLAGVAQPVHADAPGLGGLFGVLSRIGPEAARVVAQAMQAQAELEHREAHLRSILDSAPDGMIVIDEAGIVQSFGRAAERIFGYGAAEICGRNVSVLMAAPHRQAHDSYLQRYMQTRERRVIGIGRTVTGQRKDGSTFPLQLSVGETHQGGRRLFTGFIQDLTERQRTETELHSLQAELLHVSRLSALGQMATTLAHELNQPLTAITNYMKAARRLRQDEAGVAGTAPDRVSEAMDRAAEQARRAGEIIRRLREFVSRGEAEKQAEPLAALLEEATALAFIGAKQRGVECSLEIEPGCGMVLADKIQIQQVLLNLIRNAIEAVDSWSRQSVSVVARRRGDETEIAVADTGPGLAADVADQLFRPFVTTKSSGMGVGLSICRSIVEAHGGRIWAEPRPGGGTVFRFTLTPITEGAAA